MSVHPVVVIGAGPSGLAAALQLRRYGIQPLLLEGGQVGGLLHNANLVENYPGFPAGIPGPQLVSLIVEHALRGGVVVTASQVLLLDFDPVTNLFVLQTNEQSYAARIAVVASGTHPLPLTDPPVPPEVQGRLFYEVYPLLEAAGQHIAILGAGDAAFDYALNLCARNTVTILNREQDVKCLPLLYQRALAQPRIHYLPQTRVTQLSAAPHGGVCLECRTPAGVETLEANLLIAAIGRQPRLDIISPALQPQVEALESRGLLYRVGDVKNGLYRQTAIAVGDGILAAMKIAQLLKETAA